MPELLDESVASEDEGFRTKEYGAEYKIVQQGKTLSGAENFFKSILNICTISQSLVIPLIFT